MDHLPRASNQRRILPRRCDDTRVVGRNQRTSVMSCFVYGQTPEKMTIKMARDLAPAFHISIVDFAMLNSKKPSTSNESPAKLPLKLTVPPRLRCPERKSAMFPRMMIGMKIRRNSG